MKKSRNVFIFLEDTGTTGIFPKRLGYNSYTMKNSNLFLTILMCVLFLHFGSFSRGQSVTTERLIGDMTDLERLTRYPGRSYKTVQFSSYDRRSTSPYESGWFANSDGFGGEPEPGFEKVLREPDEDGIGEYLICDVQKPGAIVRLWTARINGHIRVYLDDIKKPVFEGKAEEFFWNTYQAISGKEIPEKYQNSLRQYDAFYFPITFSERCRIEWIGDIDKLHFYHIQMRLYDRETSVETIDPEGLEAYSEAVEKTKRLFMHPEKEWNYQGSESVSESEHIPAHSVKNLIKLTGNKAIERFEIKLTANDIKKALRQGVLNIYFDDASVPQVQAPIGDFFGTAPGIDPYSSLPFTVNPDGSMICRFIMPFKENARIAIDNLSDEDITVSASLRLKDYDWEQDESMHFRAHWRADHHMTASESAPFDIPYILGSGKGRLAGATAFIMNPCDVPTSWGNWWGEGDEKIFVDQDKVPSIFGTGSEDYFNYSWSSRDIFDHAYCGQPRNDGPGNRGFVTNYRYQILDDVPFENRIDFYMELLSHSRVSNFSYSRITYLYAFPHFNDDHREISKQDVVMPELPEWNQPEARFGAANSVFYEAEILCKESSIITIRKGDIWTKGKYMLWKSGAKGETLKLQIPVVKDTTVNIAFTAAHSPESGNISVWIDGNDLKFGNESIVDLHQEHALVSRNHVSQKIELEEGLHELIIENMQEGPNSVGIDFVWVKY